MMDFLGLLAAVVGLITLISLSIVELLAIPWPVLLILLLATLWCSQRLLDQFNPNPVPVDALKSTPTVKGDVKVKVTSPPPENTRVYRGQPYAGKDSIASGNQTSEEKCYRGLKDKHKEAISPALLDNEKPVQAPILRYRGVKTR